jgi:nucleotide-binding universal stress UspA family protein
MSFMTAKALRKIMVAVDGSPSSEKAVMHAIELAKKTNAELSLVHVIEDIKMGGVIGARAKYGDVKLIEGYNRVRKESATQWMRSLEERMKEKVKVSSDILYDTGKSITGMIVEHAEKNDVDLIVVGTRGLSSFRRLLIGSVARGVSNHAPCPVLIVR